LEFLLVVGVGPWAEAPYRPNTRSERPRGFLNACLRKRTLMGFTHLATLTHPKRYQCKRTRFPVNTGPTYPR
jgi:hypothetical protein